MMLVMEALEQLEDAEDPLVAVAGSAAWQAPFFVVSIPQVACSSRSFPLFKRKKSPGA